ncbi:hypothetical protein BCD64_00880 [Nostoc sp. MBR 210]|nr:hypothetical protein BCD64_00880 [Nostoc sp. MBR 210]
MAADEIKPSQLEMPGCIEVAASNNQAASKSTKPKKQNKSFEPPNLGKAVRLQVPDFSDPNRSKTCLEVNFPIVPINALSTLEGNAGKPIYQMSKWWARRRSSVFRSLLIAAAVQAPEDPMQAEKQVWDHYYCNHQKAGHFKKLRVLDCFMGGGTTLVEGARLGFQMTGVDLNPVAWFVVKNELACSEPEQVEAFFNHIECEVKPLVQPFYTTTCPRGHKGHWIETSSKQVVAIEPLDLPPEQRKPYHWEGPEVIYTFWAKHGPCQASGCGHRTPIFKNPIIAEKKLTAYYIPITCSCEHEFNAELGETRIAPSAERVVLDNEPSFTELSQPFAQLLKDYSKGKADEKYGRVADLLRMVEHEPGLVCPKCGVFAGQKIKSTLETHQRSSRVADLKKQDFGIQSRHTYMYLLLKPDWLKGNAGAKDGNLLGGYAGADAESTVKWYDERLKTLALVEVRGRIKLAEEEASTLDEEEESVAQTEELSEDDSDTSDRKQYGLPREIVLKDGTRIQTRQGSVPRKSTFTCSACGRQQDILEAVKPSRHTAPVTPYALQCHCPQCEAEDYNYGGRYFKAPDKEDLNRLARAEREWAERAESDLAKWWPREELFEAYMTYRLNGGIPNWGYTHWWKMFNPRQLLVHTQVLQAITNISDKPWSLDIREQALGAFQQYLRNQNMFCFWDKDYDKLVPHFSNANYHPKSLVVENSVFGKLGRGNFSSCRDNVLNGISWCQNPWEAILTKTNGNTRSIKAELQDALIPDHTIYCQSSTDLSTFSSEFDLVITDPPFGNNLFYADLADFFYVWLRIPLLKWYQGLPERAYFEPEFTPKALEAIKNPAEHPDEREDWEKDRKIRQVHLETIQSYSNDSTLKPGDPNPMYRPEPAEDFYQQTLCACWAEAGRLLKPGGIMAFTFHHNEDEAWVNVLEALFNAGYVLVATYPIRSDETKGSAANAAFGSKKIEYDIIHVCRKQLDVPQPVSWAKMRRWVKEEVGHLKELLEHSHSRDLPEADLRVILRGKALEFYSRHYGQVYTGEGEILSVREALLGINLILDDLTEETSQVRPPDAAEPATRLFLRIFTNRTSIPRDELHKILRGTGISQGDLEERRWIRSVGTTIHVVPIEERFEYFTAPGRNRKVIKTDLDQTHFLIGAAIPGSGIKIDDELNRKTLSWKRSTDALLQWYAERGVDQDIRDAARVALSLVSNWRTSRIKQVQVLNKQLELSLWETMELEEITHA